MTNLIRSLLFLGALFCFLAGPALEADARRGGDKSALRKYKIFCVNGVVQVENSTADEIIDKRKAKVCELTRTEFMSLSRARKGAKRFGGAGAPCPCSENAQSKKAA